MSARKEFIKLLEIDLAYVTDYETPLTIASQEFRFI